MRVRHALIAFAVVACRDHAPPPPAREAPPRRVIEPPRGDVRALPPHAITADGVGPYKLAMTMAQIVSAVPSGPRIALMQIPGVVDTSVVRDAGIVIGGRPQGAVQFVAVVRQAIARTADGVGVGTDQATVARALGPAARDAHVARDPGLWVGTTLPEVRVALFADRVAALVLSPAVTPPPDDIGCARPALTDLVELPATARAACLPGAVAVAAVAGQVVAWASDGGKARRGASVDVPGLRWAAPIRATAERDEVVAVSERSTKDARTVIVTVLAIEDGRWTKLAEVDAYRLTETSAAWLGARLADLALRLEVTRQADDLVIGGLLLHVTPDAVADVAQLVAVPVRINRKSGDDRERVRLDAGVTAVDGAP